MTRLLRRYPPANDELRKDRASWRLALPGLLLVIVASTVVGGLQVDRQKNVSGSAPVAFSFSLAALLSSLWVGVANNHYAKAIEAHNRPFH